MLSIIRLRKLVFSLILTMTLLKVNCQEQNNHIKVIVGGGYGYYFNTFSNVSNDDIAIYKPNFSAKLIWQPEYKLRIGIESGYYPIYSTSKFQTDNNTIQLTTHLDVIPFFFNISMVLHKNLEASFATGWASMKYFISSKNGRRGSVTGSTMSKYNILVGLNYYLPIGKRIDIGTEVKYLYLGKTLDNHMSVTISMSYKIFSWK